MPRSAAGRAAPSRAACARVASSARVGPLAGRTRTHAGVAVPRARVEVSRNFSRVRMGEGRLGAANRRLGAHSRRAQTQGRLSKMLCDATKYFDERPSPQITSRGSRRGRPMGWNSKVAKNSSTSCSLEHPLPPPFTPSHPPPPSPPSPLPPRGPPPSHRAYALGLSLRAARRLLQEIKEVRQTKTEWLYCSTTTYRTQLAMRLRREPSSYPIRPVQRFGIRGTIPLSRDASL